MTVQAISLPVSQSQTSSKASASSANNYLNRYVECDPAKLAASHARKEKLWKIASIAVLVAYTVIVALAAVITGIFATAYLPIAIATAITLTPFVFPLYKSLQEKAQKQGQQAKIEQGVADRLKKLPTSSADIVALLGKMGLTTAQIQNLDKLSSLSQLRPAIARYQHWEDVAKDMRLESHNQGKDVIGVNHDSAKEPEKVREARLQTLLFLEEAQIAKVSAAFLLCILRNPCIRGDIYENDLFAFKPVSAGDRLLRAAFQDPSHDTLVEVKNRQKSVIGLHELDRLSIEQISGRLVVV